MSVNTFKGLQLQLAGQSSTFDMGNLVHRRAAALALQTVDGLSISGDLITGLNEGPGTLTPDLRDEFNQITSTNPQYPAALVNAVHEITRRERAASGIDFVDTQLSMEGYLRACHIGPKAELPGISEPAVRAWGGYEGQSTKNFREPRTLQVAQAVALHADTIAMREGQRVDPLEFAGHIYPELRIMLEEATRANNVVYVKPPVFMAHIPFREHTFQKFAAGLAGSSLGKSLGKDLGIPPDRLHNYISDKGGKIMPYVSTLRAIARAIAVDALAAEDGQYAKEVFRYLMVLRMREYLTVEENGRAVSLVPIYQQHVPAMGFTSKNVVSRFHIEIKPDRRALHGSDEAAKHARRLRMIDLVMSDHYDNRIAQWEQRLNSFSAFQDVAATNPDGSRVDLRSMRIALNSFRRKHEALKRRLGWEKGSYSALNHREVEENSQMYTRLNSAFRHAMFFTHVRGTVRRDGRSIAYEIVSQPSARSAARIPSGYIPVYGGDVFAQDWSPQRQEALIALRAIRGYLSRTGQLLQSETQFAEEVAAYYWPAHLSADFTRALSDFRTLGMHDLFVDNGGVSLPMSSRQSAETADRPNFFLHDAGYANAQPNIGETKLEAMIRSFYDRMGWNIFAQGDAWVVGQYLSAIRYPHYVYDANRLASLLSQANPTGPAHDAARRRIEALFGAHSIKNEEAHQREKSGESKMTARSMSLKAFDDYRAFFQPLISHGLPIPKEEDLVRQIASGLIAQHPNVKVDATRLVKGLFAAINAYNSGLRSDDRRIPEHTLLDRGLFNVRFGRFVDAWRARNGGRELPLDLRTLISAAQSLMSMANGIETLMPQVISDEVERVASTATADQVRAASDFLSSWIRNQRRDVALMSRMLTDDTYGIDAFMETEGHRYRSPVIPDSDFSLLATRAIRRRLSNSGEIDGIAEALDVLGGRFEFLPEVRAHAARFMSAATAHYLAWLRSSLAGQLNTLVEALGLMADGEENVIDVNDFVVDLINIADAQVPTDVFHSEYPSLVSVERVYRVSGELSNGKLSKPISPSSGVVQIVRRNRKRARAEQGEIDRLMAVVQARVEKAQSALTNGRSELADMGRQVMEMMLGRASRVVAELASMSDRIPEGLASTHSSSSLRRQGRIAQFGAILASRELDFNSSALLPLVNNLQVHVMDPAFSTLRSQISGLDDRLATLGLRFEEADENISEEKDRRSREAADNRARLAIVTAKAETQRLNNLSTPESFNRRVEGLMTSLGGIESRQDDLQAFSSARSALASHETDARQILNFIDGRLAVVVRGIEDDNEPGRVIDEARRAASEADSMRDSANDAAAETVAAWDRVKEDAEQLSETRGRIHKAMSAARARLERAEQSLPPSSDVDMAGVNRVLGRIRETVGQDGTRITLAMAKRMTNKQARTAKDTLNHYARSMVVLTVGGRGYLLEMDARNEGSLFDWRDGGRGAQLMLPSVGGQDVAVAPGTYPVYSTPVGDLPQNHPLGRMSDHFAALAKYNSPARAFVAWVDRNRRRGSVEASRIWDHIVARLADPELQTGDVTGAIAQVAAAMRHDARGIDRSLNWADVVTEYKPVTRPLFEDERQRLKSMGSQQVDANMAVRVGKRRDIVHTTPHFMSAVEDSMPRDSARQRLWKALMKASPRSASGPGIRGLYSAIALWALINRSEHNGHPHAGFLRHQLLSRLNAVLFPRGVTGGIDDDAIAEYANDIARVCERFYINFYVEIEYPRIIHDRSLGYGVERHGSVGQGVVSAMGFEEGTLEHRLATEIFRNNNYMPSGYALWSAFGSDARLPHLRDAIRTLFSRYGAYDLNESEPFSLYGMLQEILDALLTMQRTGEGGTDQPAWWTTAPDAQLSQSAPEISAVSWYRIDHTVRPDDSNDPRAPIHNAAHRFVQLFPEFAGAVTIIETLRQVLNPQDHPFLTGFVALYDQAIEAADSGDRGGQRDRMAGLFRDLYVASLGVIHWALNEDLRGEGNLGRGLRIDHVIGQVAPSSLRGRMTVARGGSFDAAIDRIFRDSSN